MLATYPCPKQGNEMLLNSQSQYSLAYSREIHHTHHDPSWGYREWFGNGSVDSLIESVCMLKEHPLSSHRQQPSMI